MVRSAGRIVHLSSWLMRNAIVGKVMRRVLPSIAVIVTGFEVNDTSYMIGMLHEMAAINWMKTRANLEMVHKSSIPVLVVACEVDRLVDIEIAEEKMELFNIDKTKDVLYIDSDGVYTRDRIDDHKDKRRRGIIFAKGGHWIQNSHPEIIAMAILDLLKLVQK
ncbi:uncharacterized protein [Ptychodera flava]|uniref:uncharacterized protein n=1 Tax=Ptychodera flava TaxID=63121 RepID=UPI00396A1F71